jgi:hypothetical protein
MMKWILAGWLVGAAIGAQTPAEPLAAVYTCDGVGEEGNYTLDLKVDLFDETYIFTWLDDGRPVMRGLALRDTDQLAVALVSRGVGVALYRMVDQRLVGSWSGGDGHRYNETCERGTAKSRKSV